MCVCDGVVAGLQVYYHRVGTDDSEDVLFFESPENPKWLWGTQVTHGPHTTESLLMTSCTTARGSWCL
jgi:hypothetical protein